MELDEKKPQAEEGSSSEIEDQKEGEQKPEEPSPMQNKRKRSNKSMAVGGRNFRSENLRNFNGFKGRPLKKDSQSLKKKDPMQLEFSTSNVINRLSNI